MSERGFFALDRGLFGHPAFADEPFTEREAWTWLISEAAFRTHTRRIGTHVVNLLRGQLAASLRFLADKWKWHRSSVERFLGRLKNRDMIETRIETGLTVITICNYNKYQAAIASGESSAETQIETGARQERDKVEGMEQGNVVDGGPRATLISTQANELADEIATITGHDLKFLPPSWYGAAWRVQMWLNDGWAKPIILASVREQFAKKRDGPPSRIQYYEPGIAKAHAVQTTPLPKVEFIEGKTEVVHVGKNPRSALAAIREIRSDIGQRSLGGGEDRGIVVSLPKR